MTQTHFRDAPPVPFSAEIEPVMQRLREANQPKMTRASIAASRIAQSGGPMASPLADDSVEALERLVPGPPGGPDIEVTILRPKGIHPQPALPAVYNMHGGGMVVGHRTWETGRLVDLVTRHGVVAVNVEYRLAPEDPYPAGVEDCYAGLVWLWENAADLGIDRDRIVVMGGSAGGGLAAAIALMARDRRGPAIAGQLLLCPMVDNTNSTVSSHQYAGLGTWTREANLLAWECVLGPDLAFSDNAPAYAAPSRSVDLSGLPPAFIEVGSAELFRDEDVEFATRIWAAGGDAELHVWSGGCHGFDIYAPDTVLTAAALDARDSWLCRILAPGDEE